MVRGWSYEEKGLFEYILGHADEAFYVSENYYRGCMHKRNRYMVDNSAYCICYCTELKGGTHYTMKYAQSRGLEVVNIAE